MATPIESLCGLTSGQNLSGEKSPKYKTLRPYRFSGFHNLGGGIVEARAVVGGIIGTLVGLVFNWYTGDQSPIALVAVVSGTIGFVTGYTMDGAWDI